jgi:hypothetical protein
MTHSPILDDELPVNHEEALQLAYLKREESNLARCYLSLQARVARLEAGLNDCFSKACDYSTDERTARSMIADAARAALQSGDS